MGRFERNGEKKQGIDSEEFQHTMEFEAGAVECCVKDCRVKIGQGNKGQSLNVCIECIEYVCNDHLYRHPNCSEGR